ncbi:cytochrome P450 [Streptomyces sp. NPDC059697]|uniref:cytochrome P450 n=1 Tax=Streptomyces sp. NPDC059697 TaxID=3346912 RepID=UPI0036AB29E0
MSDVVPQPERVWTTGTAPGTFPIVGHAITLFRQPLAFLTSLPAHGDLVEVRLGPQRAWMACHPELVHQILMDPRTYDKGGPLYDKLRLLMGDGLVTCGQEGHRRQRRLVQPSFRPSRITDYAETMGEEAELECRQWQAGEFDVSGALMALTTRVTSRVLLSDSLDAATAAEVRDCLAVIVRGLFVRMVAPIEVLFRIPTPANRRYRRALNRLHTIIDSAIEERRTGAPRNDLLGTLLATGGGSGGSTRLTEQEVHDQLITLLLTGVEAPALCLASAFRLLAAHPEVERRVHREVDAVLAGRRRPRPDDLPRLVYTRCVVDETLRMYPPGWLFTRITTTDANLAGRRLPRGTTVLYSPYLLHHDPASFPDPDRFVPERWLPGRQATVPSGAMLPFAAGNRKCMGDTFAMAEATLAIAAIASQWRLRSLPGCAQQPVPAVTLGHRSLAMICEPRPRTRAVEPSPESSVAPKVQGVRQARQDSRTAGDEGACDA